MQDIARYQAQLQYLQNQYRSLIEMEEQQDLKTVQQYAAKLETIQQVYKKLPVTIPRPETIPAIFNRSYDENFISDYLAYVLDPERNGIGTGPLEALLRLVSVEADEVEFEDVELDREYTLDSCRIDLLINLDNMLVVGIENKIFAGERENQTGYYARVIRRDFKDYDHALIFLSPDGSPPQSKYFQAVSYAQLLETFRAISYNWTADVKKSVIWEDFLQHLEVYIVKERTGFDFSPRSELYLENIKMIDDLSNAFSDDWGRLLDYIEAKLNSHVNDPDWETHFSKSRHIWHQIYKTSWQQKNLYIHYEYFFDPQRLSEGILDFMFDVEGTEVNNFIRLFDKKFSNLIDEYSARSIEYRPTHRKHAIAWKTYNFDSPFEKWDERFIDAYDEFSFLTPHIEAVLAEYSASVESLG